MWRRFVSGGLRAAKVRWRRWQSSRRQWGPSTPSLERAQVASHQAVAPDRGQGKKADPGGGEARDPPPTDRAERSKTPRPGDVVPSGTAKNANTEGGMRKTTTHSAFRGCP